MSVVEGVSERKEKGLWKGIRGMKMELSMQLQVQSIGSDMIVYVWSPSRTANNELPLLPRRIIDEAREEGGEYFHLIKVIWPSSEYLETSVSLCIMPIVIWITEAAETWTTFLLAE